MGPNYANQLAPLSGIFGEVYRKVCPARLALLGCAMGNGLEHVDSTVTKRVVAIDVHPGFVAVTKERYGESLGRALEVLCADLTSCALPAGGFDLVHAALIFEHVDPSISGPSLSRAEGPSRSANTRGASSMLELRPTCEHCNTALPPETTEARICSFECTFCRPCAEDLLGNVCPNCGGNFAPRPIRPPPKLRAHPARAEVKHRPVDLAAHARLVASLQPPDRC
jgi:uncharacterized protein